MNKERAGLAAVLLAMTVFGLSMNRSASPSSFDLISSGEMVDITEHLKSDEWTVVYFAADW